jgi:hypothetical protein
MEHPLVEVDPNMSLDDLQTRIADLTKKLMWAQRHNAHLAGQIRMALDTFQSSYRAKQQQAYDAATKNGKDFSDKINVS